MATERDSDDFVGEEPIEDAAGATEENEATRRRHPFVNFLRETVVVLVGALVLSLLVKSFLAQAFYIPSQSMSQTLEVGDRLVVSKLTPDVFDVERGDIVVFLDPGGWLTVQPAELTPVEKVLTFIGILPQHADEHVIKRVIGLPGDRVKCCTDDGLLSVNGEPIEEPYLAEGVAPSDIEFDKVVPEGHLWLMGDNRPRSADSRYNTGSVGGGFVPIRNVVGTAFVITWPLDRITWLSDPTAFDNVPAPQ